MTLTLSLYCILMPLLVLPMVLDNSFNTPKTAFTAVVTSVLVFVFYKRPTSRRMAGLVLALVTLNFISFFYTQNPYYTAHAVALNLMALTLFHFTSMLDQRGVFWVLVGTAAGGILVSLETWLQFFNVFILFTWAQPGINVMGTIGNSNYLGAYLLFPLFSLAGLTVLLKGKWRLAPAVGFLFVFCALIFSRARAAWLGLAIGFPLFLYLLRVSWKRIAYLGIGTLLLCAVAWQFAPPGVKILINTATHSESLRLRIQKYSASSWYLFKQSPIFGQGLWSYRATVFEAQARLQEKDPTFFTNYPEPKPEAVHNEYLEVLNDGGLVAAGVLLAFLVTLFMRGGRSIQAGSVEAVIAMCAVVAILVDATLFFPFRINTTLFMTAIFMGLMESTWQKGEV